jgi:tRNA G18 (ribose-2'-O)-methylase SpoU
MEQDAKEDHQSQIEDERNHNYLIITNIAKKKNVFQLIQTAVAYNLQPVLVCSLNIRDSLSETMKNQLLFFDSLEDLRNYMTSTNTLIIGIEILESAVPVTEYQFPLQIALMPGNEGTGLSTKQISICDGFVFIPQYGVSTASLNVHVATGIILHHRYRQLQTTINST